jgi:CubicO group peptidase (beta-lactamase class C family)
MRLVEAGRLDLDTPVGERIPAWRSADRRAATVRDLLAHASGLPAFLPLYESCKGRTDFERAISLAPLEFVPGTRSIYSDLGFILLGFILADVGGLPLDAQWRAGVGDLVDVGELLAWGPLVSGAFTGEDDIFDRVAPTQEDRWRGRLLRGEVDDRNAAALGGVAGHAGMFGTVAAVGRFARAMLRGRLGIEGPGNPVARPDTISRFVGRAVVPGSSRALGWDTMLPTSSCGTRMSGEAFGHTGFTGTSIWIDPAADVYVVLLTNRVHPEAGPAEPIRELRRAFHDAVMEEIGA